MSDNPVGHRLVAGHPAALAVTGRNFSRSARSRLSQNPAGRYTASAWYGLLAPRVCRRLRDNCLRHGKTLPILLRGKRNDAACFDPYRPAFADFMPPSGFSGRGGRPPTQVDERDDHEASPPPATPFTAANAVRYLPLAVDVRLYASATFPSSPKAGLAPACCPAHFRC